MTKSLSAEELVDRAFWHTFAIPAASDNSIERRKLSKLKYKESHPDYQKEWWQRLKAEILTHYGNGVLACVRCGFSDLRALSLDHIYGGGRKVRQDPKYNAGSFYLGLRRDDYPPGYQTLCMNCQYIKRVENKEVGDNGKNRLS